MSSEIDGTTTIVCGSWFIASIECQSGTKRSCSSSKRCCACGGDAGNPVSVSMKFPSHAPASESPSRLEQVSTYPRRVPASFHARDLAFSYGPRLVLDGVELLAAPGTRIGVLGPNGAGKSTLLGVLSGRLLPEGGSVQRTPPTATVGELR